MCKSGTCHHSTQVLRVFIHKIKQLLQNIVTKLLQPVLNNGHLIVRKKETHLGRGFTPCLERSIRCFNGALRFSGTHVCDCSQGLIGSGI